MNESVKALEIWFGNTPKIWAIALQSLDVENCQTRVEIQVESDAKL